LTRGRGRGRRRHTGRRDLRGAAGRPRAIRAALADGWDPAAFATAVAAGDPFGAQLVLPVAVPGETFTSLPAPVRRAGPWTGR